MGERRKSRFERGVTLFDGGHYEEARSYLAESLEKEGYSEECYVAYNDVCNLLNGNGRFPDREEIEEDDTQDDSLQEASLMAMEQGIRHLQKKRYGRAIHKLREAVQVVPETATDALLMALNEKAKQYIERKLFRKAIMLYDECLTLEGNSLKIYYQRAWAHLHAGNIVQAQMDVAQAQHLQNEGEGFLAERRRIENDEAGASLSHTDGATPLSLQGSLQALGQLLSH